MTTILGASASALAHYQTVMDTIGHNVANINSPAFRRTRTISEGAPTTNTDPAQARLGVAQSTADLILSPGAALRDDNPLHFSIQDDAFFRVHDFDGSIAYTRMGGLDTDSAGNLTAFRGRFLEPPITVPQGLTSLAISANGTITGVAPDGSRQELGQLTLVHFLNPQGLRPMGDGLYAESVNSGAITEGVPGESGFAELIPGSLEGSNVDLAEEFTNMLIAQRAYSASAKTFSIGDQMLELATNLTH
jgi:flagellar basal body rod protein FlgG